MSRLPTAYAGDPAYTYKCGAAHYFWHPPTYEPYPCHREHTKPLSAIQCVSKAEHVDGETLTVTFGIPLAGCGGYQLPRQSWVFEFDVAGDGVAGTNVQVNISAVATAAEVAAVLLAAMQGVMTTGPVRAFIDPADNTIIVVRSLWHGILLAVSETVTDADFIVTTLEKYVQCANFHPGPGRLHMPYDRTPSAGSFPTAFQNQEAYSHICDTV